MNKIDFNLLDLLNQGYTVESLAQQFTEQLNVANEELTTQKQRKQMRADANALYLNLKKFVTYYYPGLFDELLNEGDGNSIINILDEVQKGANEFKALLDKPMKSVKKSADQVLEDFMDRMKW